MPDANNVASGLVYARARLAVIRDATISTLEQMSDADRAVPSYVESMVLKEVNGAIAMENANRKGQGEAPWKPLVALMPSQIADISDCSDCWGW